MMYEIIIIIYLKACFHVNQRPHVSFTDPSSKLEHKNKFWQNRAVHKTKYYVYVVKVNSTEPGPAYQKRIKY